MQKQLPQPGDEVHYVPFPHPDTGFRKYCERAVISDVKYDGLIVEIFVHSNFIHSPVKEDDAIGAPCTHIRNGQENQPEYNTWHYPEDNHGVA